jgi:hypothetical protein
MVFIQLGDVVVEVDTVLYLYVDTFQGVHGNYNVFVGIHNGANEIRGMSTMVVGASYVEAQGNLVKFMEIVNNAKKTSTATPQ